MIGCGALTSNRYLRWFPVDSDAYNLSLLLFAVVLKCGQIAALDTKKRTKSCQTCFIGPSGSDMSTQTVFQCTSSTSTQTVPHGLTNRYSQTQSVLSEDTLSQTDILGLCMVSKLVQTRKPWMSNVNTQTIRLPTNNIKTQTVIAIRNSSSQTLRHGVCHTAVQTETASVQDSSMQTEDKGSRGEPQSTLQPDHITASYVTKSPMSADYKSGTCDTSDTCPIEYPLFEDKKRKKRSKRNKVNTNAIQEPGCNVVEILRDDLRKLRLSNSFTGDSFMGSLQEDRVSNPVSNSSEKTAVCAPKPQSNSPATLKSENNTLQDAQHASSMDQEKGKHTNAEQNTNAKTNSCMPWCDLPEFPEDKFEVS